MKKINVTKSEYIISAVGKNQYPEEKFPEIVFLGRSNVGKSSLINFLTGRKNLARTSQTPGKTQTINFFKTTLKISSAPDDEPENLQVETKNFYLVDLPGYGYAKTSKSNRNFWAKFIDEYLTTRKEIEFVCQLIDLRHPPQESDIKMFNYLVEKNLPVLIAATKSDKLSKNEQRKQLAVIKKVLGIDEDAIIPTSAKKNEGRSDLLDVIASSLVK